MIPLLLQALQHRPDKQQLLQFKAPQLPDVNLSRSFTLDPEHYRRYCGLVEWPVDGSLHPCYLQMCSLDLQMQCLTDKHSPFPVLGLVHRTNDIRYPHPLKLKGQLNLQVGFKQVQAHKKGWEVTMEVSARQSGVLVYQALSGYLVRVKAPHVETKSSHRPKQPQDYSHWQLQGSLEASANIGRRYARVSGDYNPIHLHAVSARLFGFNRAIAHGMWSLARCISLLAPGTGDATGWAQIQCEFIKPWLLPGEGILKRNNQVPDLNFILLNNSEEVPYLKGTIALRDPS